MTIEPAKEPVIAREEAVRGLTPSGTENMAPSRSTIDAHLRVILRDVLALDAAKVENFDGDTGLFGHLPELDSMAVASLFTEMEDRLDIIIEDEDVDGEMLETYGGLLAFAESKSVSGTITEGGSN